MKKILFIILMATCTISISAQKKNVIIDVSHDVDTIYTYVNPNIFNLYKDIVEKQMGANLIINKDKELNEAFIGIGGGNNAPQNGENLSFSFDISGDSFVLQDENGKVIAAYTLSSERSMNNVVVMSKELEKGKTYSVISGASIESEGNFNGLGLGSVTYKDGVVSYSSIAQSVASGNHYSMGGGM